MVQNMYRTPLYLQAVHAVQVVHDAAIQAVCA